MTFSSHVLAPLAALACLFQLVACSHQASTAPEITLRQRARARTPLAVLFVGNSYSFGVPKAFQKAAHAAGKRVRTGQATSNGWTLHQHAKHEATLKTIREGRWDIVVLQEQSQLPALPGIVLRLKMFPPLKQLADTARTSGALPVLYQTWGRRDGDFYGMNARLRTGYHAAAKAAGGLAVVPVGDAWEQEVSAGRGHPLFHTDGSHPTTLGNALTARVFVTSFFGK